MNPKCRETINQMLEEFKQDMMAVFEFGNRKHPDNGETPNFLMPEGNKCSLEARGNSCLHHASDTRAGKTEDHESKLHPALHGGASFAILYIRHKRGIKHSDDSK